jgi:hypothetical protein
MGIAEELQSVVEKLARMPVPKLANNGFKSLFV